MDRRINNILAIRNDRFGEFLLNIPALRALKETYPDAKLTLGVDTQVKGLAETVKYADKVAVWDELRNTLRQWEFDVCVALNPTKEAHLSAFLAGIPVRVGYSRKWGFLLTHKMQDNKNLGLKHEVESNLELVSLIGANTSDKSISLERLPQYNNLTYAGAIAVHPHTSDPVKHWTNEQFGKLIRCLVEEISSKVIIVGKEELTCRGREFFDDLGDNDVVNLINKTSLVELAQILKQCRLLVTCDSGPMHLAAAVGTPVVALFRNDLPGKTAKRWGPWGEGHIVIEKNKLEEITTDEVFNKVKEVLREK